MSCQRLNLIRIAALTAMLLALDACKFTNGPPPTENEAADPPEVVIGERLFKDTRFGHYFAAQSGGDVNASLGVGESVVEDVKTLGQPLPGPMAGEAVNCLQCHLVEQLAGTAGGGMRAYADFAARSPMPARAEDTLHGGFTARNAASMVNDARHGGVDRVLHWDGEFGSMQDLVTATLTGRNFGWMPGEQEQAVHHVAQVIRFDSGEGALARSFGALPYRVVLSCTDQNIPAIYRLPKSYCLDVAQASDAELEAAVAKLIAAYVDSLSFFQDEDGRFNGSPFDQFLIDNHLQREPAAGQSPHDYSAALLRALDARKDLKPVECCTQYSGGKAFAFHGGRPFKFGAAELRGLHIFLARPVGGGAPAPTELAQGGIGNCAACHAPPEFSDFGMHNTGVAQAEYDGVHGAGGFMALNVPTLPQRDADPDKYLPVTPQHPHAREPFRAASIAADPDKADLGAWNIFANPDFARRKASLRKFLCAIDTHEFADCGAGDAALLDRSLGVFKTRVLRDMGDSAPFMHDGGFDTLEQVVRFYQHAGRLARAGQLRNADPAMQGVVLNDGDVADLAAFLGSLDEDYSD
ncbi:MAG TPA: hypothetical protein VF651_06240 [Gammaproteobacteria bacterium]